VSVKPALAPAPEQNRAPHRHWPWLALTFAGALGLSWQSQSAFNEQLALFWALVGAMQLGGVGLWMVRWAPSGRSIFLIALSLHALALLGRPMFEDDYYRYLWDGYRTAVATPYGTAPEAFFTDDSVPDALRPALDGMNNPEIPTIYGPFAQQVFALGYQLAPGSERALRAVLALLHLALLGMVLRFARQGQDVDSFLPCRSSRDSSGEAGKSDSSAVQLRQTLALYVLSPLVFKEVALTGHFDFLVPMALIAAWLVLGSMQNFCVYSFAKANNLPNYSFAKANKIPGRQFFAGACVGVAFASKLVAVLALPLLIWRGGWRLVVGFSLAVLALYWPFMHHGGGSLSASSDLLGLSAFANTWRFNAGLFSVIERIAGQNLAKLCAAALLAGMLLFASLRAREVFGDIPALSAGLFSVLILAGPVINPWYWLWVLPWLALDRHLHQGVRAMAACAIGTVLLLSYGHGLYLDPPGLAPYALPGVLQLTEHVLIGVLVLWALWRAKPVARM
jgi:alpha-1,6-mannosyltransferase